MKPLLVISLCGFVFAVSWLIQTISAYAGLLLDLTARSGIGQVTLYAVGIGGVYLFVRYVWQKSTGQYFQAYWENRHAAALGFLTLYGMAAVAVIALYIVCYLSGTAEVSDRFWSRLTLPNFGNIAVSIIAAAILAATEELVFRGFSFRYFLGNGGKWTTASAVSGSAFFFALVHNFRDPLAWFTLGELPLLIGLTLLGVVLAYTYLATGSLTCSIGLHGGLLAVHDVILERTRLLELDQSVWWMGVNNDIRTAPIAWLSLIILAAAIWHYGPQLRRKFGIETLIPEAQYSKITAARFKFA